MSSRIFVRNLPPNFSDNELRKYFSVPDKSAGTTFSATVTDSKFIPRKRIGFIGYKSPEDAQRAVDYFNRSFIRLSRISVELAKEANDEELQQLKEYRAKRRFQEPAEVPDGKRHKGDLTKDQGNADTQKDEKLQEYLSLMGSTKTKAWANGQDLDAGVQDPKAVSTVPPEDLSEDEGEYQDLQRKPTTADTSATTDSPSQTENQQDVGSSVPTENTALQPISDADWLKSLTKNSSLETDNAAVENPAPEVFPEEPAVEDRMDVDNTDSTPVTIAEATSEDPNIVQIQKSGRLFLRNLSYTATEEDLTKHFETFGNLESIHICLDKKTGESKGIAFAQFAKPESAIEAYTALDGKSWQGRIFHIIPADPQPNQLNEFDISKLPFKKQQALKLKAESAKRKFNWNSLYMNPDAIMASTAKRFAVPKSAILDPTSSDAAVKQALAETHVIQETKEYFKKYGVDLEAFKHQARGDKAILVKNFEFGTSPDTIKTLFEEHGTITRLLFPPAGTIAIVELQRPDQASRAFNKLKYARLGNSLLFLEMAPKDLFIKDAAAQIESAGPSVDEPAAPVVPVKETIAASDLLDVQDDVPLETSSLFVKNLSFSTTTEGLTKAFMYLPGFVSAQVKTKPNLKNPSAPLSMGFGFLEFRTKEEAAAALASRDGHVLDGYKLQLKISNKGTDAAEERRKADNEKKSMAAQTKLVVKNLPFEATKQDIRTLLSAHGQLRSVRVPKKLDSSSRGFAFAEFTTPAEARAALDALKNTHLLGRKLVIQFASAELIDPEAEIERMQKKVGSQMDKLAVKNLMGSGQRKKFVVGGGDEDEEV